MWNFCTLRLFIVKNYIFLFSHHRSLIWQRQGCYTDSIRFYHHLEKIHNFNNHKFKPFLFWAVQQYLMDQSVKTKNKRKQKNKRSLVIFTFPKFKLRGSSMNENQSQQQVQQHKAIFRKNWLSVLFMSTTEQKWKITVWILKYENIMWKSK